MLSETEVREISRRLKSDSGFQQAFDSDPLAALQGAGFAGAAEELSQGMAMLRRLGQRLESEDSLSAQAQADPVRTLLGEGVPAPLLEPILRTTHAPEAVLAQVSEVEATWPLAG